MEVEGGDLEAVLALTAQPDSFSFRADDGTYQSSAATVDVMVGGPPPAYVFSFEAAPPIPLSWEKRQDGNHPAPLPQ